VRTSGKTGVEMEAMTAASIGCLTVYDMVKSLDRSIAIGPIVLTRKSGGKSGDYIRG
jgi:cyclic pyranopterin phosphate synthase